MRAAGRSGSDLTHREPRSSLVRQDLEALTLFLGSLTLLIFSQSGSAGTAFANRCGSPALAATADALAGKLEGHRFLSIGSTHGDVPVSQAIRASLAVVR